MRSEYSQVEHMAAEKAKECRRRLREHIGDKPVTLEILVHDDNDFAVKAFHTCWTESGRDNFAREVVEFDTYDESSSPDGFSHAVNHYATGRHSTWFRYSLDEHNE